VDLALRRLLATITFNLKHANPMEPASSMNAKMTKNAQAWTNTATSASANIKNAPQAMIATKLTIATQLQMLSLANVNLVT
jgi:hypothetical protein